MPVTELWRHLLQSSAPKRAGWRSAIEVLLEEGCLSERILKATGNRPGHNRLKAVYRRLAGCLQRGEQFHA